MEHEEYGIYLKFTTANSILRRWMYSHISYLNWMICIVRSSYAVQKILETLGVLQLISFKSHDVALSEHHCPRAALEYYWLSNADNNPVVVNSWLCCLIHFTRDTR